MFRPNINKNGVKRWRGAKVCALVLVCDPYFLSASSLACLSVFSPSPAISLSTTREGFRAGKGVPDPDPWYLTEPWGYD
jgi:hypothetical protein